MTRHFFVCGTGRSGSLSIARFFSSQPLMYCLHEGGDAEKFAKHRLKQQFRLEPILKWHDDWSRVHAHYERLLSSRNEAFLGDVGMYLIPYTEQLLAAYPDAKFICLERDKQEVVESFTKRVLDLRADRKQRPQYARQPESLWDCNYPTFVAPDPRTSIEMYWDHYHELATELEAKYPNTFRIFPTEALNSSDGRHALLDFIGYPKTDRRDERVHANKESSFLTRLNKTRAWLRRFKVRVFGQAQPSLLPATPEKSDG